MNPSANYRKHNGQSGLPRLAVVTKKMTLKSLLITILIYQCGCSSLPQKPPDLAWHLCYQPIASPEAHAFLNNGIALLKQRHGEPDIPVRQVLLRHSVKSPAGAPYAIRESFSLTEQINPDQGLFCIYLSVPPTHKRFYYLLGHEIAHLLNPTIINNPHEEQFCNEFSQYLCGQENKPWNETWETRPWVSRTDAP